MQLTTQKESLAIVIVVKGITSEFKASEQSIRYLEIS